MLNAVHVCRHGGPGIDLAEYERRTCGGFLYQDFSSPKPEKGGGITC